MSDSRNVGVAGDWDQANGGDWAEEGYYPEDATIAPAQPQPLLKRIWTGRPMIYIIAAGLVAATALVLVTRPGGDAAPAQPAVTAPTPYVPITYDDAPVVDPEFMKP